MVHFYRFFLIFTFKNRFLRSQACNKQLFSNHKRLSGITYRLFCFARYTKHLFITTFHYTQGPQYNQVPIQYHQVIIIRCLFGTTRYLFSTIRYLLSTIRCLLGTTKYLFSYTRCLFSITRCHFRTTGSSFSTARYLRTIKCLSFHSHEFLEFPKYLPKELQCYFKIPQLFHSPQKTPQVLEIPQIYPEKGVVPLSFRPNSSQYPVLKQGWVVP